MQPAWIVLLLFLGVSASQEEEPPAAERVGKDMCMACHEVESSFLSSVHSVRECEDCHGAGSLHMDAGGDMSLSFAEKTPQGVTSQCLSCHGLGFREVSQFLRGPHGKNQLICTDCHEIHPDRANFGLLKESDSVKLCVSCHKGTEATFRKPFHHPVLEKAMECIDCHNPHLEPANSLNRLEVVPRYGCETCHADKSGPFVFEHASLALNGCESCHQPHGSFNSKMLIRSEVHQLCLECHSMTTDLTAGSQPPAFHDLRTPQYRNCTVCHREIHGSNSSPAFLR